MAMLLASSALGNVQRRARGSIELEEGREETVMRVDGLKDYELVVDLPESARIEEERTAVREDPPQVVFDRRKPLGLIHYHKDTTEN